MIIHYASYRFGPMNGVYHSTACGAPWGSGVGAGVVFLWEVRSDVSRLSVTCDVCALQLLADMAEADMAEEERNPSVWFDS